MPEPTTVERTAFVTFYSFKGGVGRSMALINVAGIMAGRGFKIMALDMDLEAPGISYLMRHESKQENVLLPGFVDLLLDACERGEEADLFALNPSEVIDRYSYPYQVPAEIKRSDEGCLRIMPAGKFDGHYQERLNDLNLGQLYLDGQGQPLSAAFKKVIADAACFDFVFIDSRTGFSDESGICTRDLADSLVVVMGLNRQNQEGTAEFLRSLKESNAAPKGMRIVLSPVPNGEDELLDACEKEASRLLSEAWGKPLDLTLQIPYHPRLALTEEPHIFRRSRGYLYEAYAAIEREVLALMGLSPDRIRKEISDNADNNRVDAVLRGLKALAKLDNGPEFVAQIAIRLENLLQDPDVRDLAQFLANTIPGSSWSIKRLASTLYEKANPSAELFFKRWIDTDPNDASAYNDLGNLYQYKLDRAEDAEHAYLRAIELDPKFAPPLSNLGSLYQYEMDRAEDAERAYLNAIKLDPKLAHPLSNLGNLYQYKLDRAEDAERAYLNAIELDPKDAYPQRNLGNLYKNKLDRPQDAERAYLKAIELDPKDDSSHHSLADLYQFYLSRPQDAERKWRSTLELDPTKVTAHQGLVILYIADLDDAARAREELQKCIELVPDAFGTRLCDCALQLWEEGWDCASQSLPSVLAASGKDDPDNWKGELRVFIRKVDELESLPALESQLTAAASEQPWWQPWSEALKALCDRDSPTKWNSPSAERIFAFLNASPGSKLPADAGKMPGLQ